MEPTSTDEGSAESFAVTPDLMPQSKEEEAERAAYVAAVLAAGCADFVQGFLLDCRNGLMGEALQKAAGRELSDNEFSAAVKELTCITIYLTVVEHGGEAAPSWLSRFLFIALRATDKIVPQPRAREIMQTHEFVSGSEDIALDASVSACRAMGFGDAAAHAAVPIQIFLLQNTAYRSDVLRYALTQPLEALRAHVTSIM
ncbi:MAG TPA: hypothetical protein V6D08_00960 [Candidatus Obscuribacterales bacterium]